jgi:phage/plasmid-associated DNA primase
MSEEFLTSKELQVLMNSAGVHESAKIIKDKLNRKCFLREFGSVSKLYVAQPENYYKQYESKEKIEEELKFIVTLLIEDSWNDLETSVQQKLKDRFPKTYKTISKNAFVQTVLPQLKRYLTEDENSDFIKSLDRSLWEIHFLNGYLNMKTGEFKKRKLAKKPVTYVIARNYEKSSNKEIKYLLKFFTKIFPDKDDLDILFLMLAKALTGDSTEDQSSLFMLGNGSNGKSLLMSVIANAFGEYVQQLGSETFVKGNSKQEKILNQFLINVYIRIAWINEMSDKLIDDAMFKDFVDGWIKTTSLYKDGQNVIKHLAQAWSTANSLPKFLADGGMKRRVDAITGPSKFVDDEDDVDEEKHVYLKDKSLLSKIIESKLNAVVDLVVTYSIRLYDGEKIETNKNQNMKATRDEIISANDTMSDFIETHLTFTDNADNQISKNAMLKRYKEYKDKSLITVNQLVSSLRESSSKIVYNPNPRNKDGPRGVFVGVKFNDMQGDDDDDDDEFDKGVDKSDKRIRANPFLQAECDKYKKMCEQLQTKVKELEKLLKKDDSDSESEDEAPVAKVPKKKPKRKVAKDDDDDDDKMELNDFASNLNKLLK